MPPHYRSTKPAPTRVGVVMSLALPSKNRVQRKLNNRESSKNPSPQNHNLAKMTSPAPALSRHHSSSPFALRLKGRTGNGNHRSRKRSGARRAAEATAMTRAIRRSFPNPTNFPARGVDVDPAQQAAAQRSITRTSLTKPAHTPQSHRAAIPYFLLPQYPREPKYHREQRNFVLKI
jgi:hypothetical protein